VLLLDGAHGERFFMRGKFGLNRPDG